MTPCVDVSVMEQRARALGGENGLLRDLLAGSMAQTPALLLSRSAIARNFRDLQSALPRVGIHYAVKPNNHAVFIDEVFAESGNFDVCSAGEIDLVLSRTRLDPASLIHSHPIKSIPEFDHAVEKGLEIFVVDNPAEVAKFARYTEKKLKVMIRFRTAVNTNAVVNLQYKFGCTADEVLPLARMIRETGHEYYGLCFHVGSQCIYSENYVNAIKTAHSLIHALDEEGFDTRVLDIGGGFPVEYVEPVPHIDEFARPINRALDEHIRRGIRIVSEPGRFIAATPVTLVTSVVGRSYRDGKIWYYLDDGLYSTFSGIVFDHCQYPVVTDKNGEQFLSVLAGPTCDSFDVMYDGLMIPLHEVGDRIVFTATGAYCSVSGSNFNALKRPDYHIID